MSILILDITQYLTCSRKREIKFQRTLLLGANAAGDLMKMLIYHSENPRALKN